MQRLELTHRQTEVLHWIAEGKTNEEIRVILDRSFVMVSGCISVHFSATKCSHKNVKCPPLGF